MGIGQACGRADLGLSFYNGETPVLRGKEACPPGSLPSRVAESSGLPSPSVSWRQEAPAG